MAIMAAIDRLIMKEGDHKISSMIQEVSIHLYFYTIEMDTTLISEIEYLNILPDMDMDDSSFLKNSYDGLKNGE